MPMKYQDFIKHADETALTLTRSSQNWTAFEQFRQIVRKYIGITELTPTIVNEFIKKIIVHAPDKSSGHRVQKIQIIFNFIGEFTPQEEFIPDEKKFPQDYF